MQRIVTSTIAMLIASGMSVSPACAQPKKQWSPAAAGSPHKVAARQPATTLDEAKKQESINQIVTGLRGLFGDLAVKQEKGGIKVRGSMINIDIGNIKVKPPGQRAAEVSPTEWSQIRPAAMQAKPAPVQAVYESTGHGSTPLKSIFDAVEHVIQAQPQPIPTALEQPVNDPDPVLISQPAHSTPEPLPFIMVPPRSAPKHPAPPSPEFRSEFSAAEPDEPDNLVP